MKQKKPYLPPVTIFALLEALVSAQTGTPSAENRDDRCLRSKLVSLLLQRT